MRCSGRRIVFNPKSDFGRFIPVLISTLKFVEIGLASSSNTRHEELDLGQNSMSPPVRRAEPTMREARITPHVAPLNAARTAQRAVPTNGWNFVEILPGRLHSLQRIA